MCACNSYFKHKNALSKSMESLPPLPTLWWGVWLYWMMGCLNYHCQHTHEEVWYMLRCVCVFSVMALLWCNPKESQILSPDQQSGLTFHGLLLSIDSHGKGKVRWDKRVREVWLSSGEEEVEICMWFKVLTKNEWRIVWPYFNITV